ncbi:MAG TPA: helical backbone metal receptor [Gemmatimonadales bacterium]|jgi:ABC-type Fe3+-hydroxamate transport system substrate-binding protein
MRRLLLASLLAVSCRPAADRPASAVPPPAQRIVSLAPSATELLFALGAGDHVVGRTTWCRYPPAALRVPDVGDGLNPNIEAVVARRPDLVVLYKSQLNESAAAQLHRLGIRSIVLAQDRLEDVARGARLLGPLVGQARAGDSIAAAIEGLLSAPPPPSHVRVAFVVWDNPPMVIGAGSYLDQLATLAGATNVFHDLRSASATVSLETIAARDPDAIVTLSDSTAPPPYASRPEWRAIRAVRERRFIMLPADLFGRPSPTAPTAVAALRRTLEAEVPR